MNFVETIRAAGVACDNGSFPVVLEPEDAVDWLICSAVSAEPLAESESCLSAMQPERVVAAISAIAEMVGAKKSVIAVRSDDAPAAQALAQAIATSHAPVELFRTDAYYPANDIPVLVHRITGRLIAERGIPADVGCAVCGVQQALDILAALEGTHVTDRYITVTGAVKRQLLLKAPIGSRIAACAAEAGPLPADACLIVGGPMRGKLLTAPSAIEATVVSKTTESIIVLPRDHPLIARGKQPLETILRRVKSSCGNCRLCTDFCPRYGLGHSMRPNRIMQNHRRGDKGLGNDEFSEAFGDAVNCCGCGVCDVVCPVNLQPRRVNAFYRGGIVKRGILVPRERQPEVRQTPGIRGIETDRLTALLGLSEYAGSHSFDLRELSADEVSIAFARKPGRNMYLIRSAGDHVEKGELLASDGIDFSIHASIGGTIVKIDASGAQIKA